MISVPTIASLREEILTDLEGALGQTIPILPKAFLRVLATALAGALAQLYRFGRWIYAQVFPATADAEALLRIGSQYGMAKRAAVASILQIQIVGDSGVEVPAASVWTGNNGLSYLQDATVTIVSGIASVRVTCLEGGTAGSLGEGNTLELATPVGGIDGASVTEIATEGEDEESTEEFRARVIQRIAGQPQGGSAADYVQWAMEVPGIVKALAFRTAAGAVSVYPLAALSGASRLPSASKLAEVQEYLASPARRPLCATVTAANLDEMTVDITITTLSPSDTATRNAIAAALAAYLYAAYPLQYPDEPNPSNVISVAAIWSAIHAAGCVAASVTMSVEGTGEVTSYTLGDDEMVTLGTVTWA